MSVGREPPPDERARDRDAVRMHGVAYDNAVLNQFAGDQINFFLPPPVPAPATQTLPADTAAFTGRRAELDAIVAAADPAGAGRVVAIHAIDGMPGVGKTALAVHAGHQLNTRFPDRQLFIDLHGHTPGRTPVSAGSALAALLTADGVDPRYLPTGLDERAALWRARLAGKRVLLIIDNVAGHDQVTPLLPGTPGCYVLITSRRRLGRLRRQYGAIIMALDTLPQDEALALFANLAARNLSGEEAAAAEELVRRCGCLPLAITILAARLQPEPQTSVAHLLAAFTATRDRLAAIDDNLDDDEMELGVAAAFDLSYRALPAPRQRLLRHLGLNPGTDLDAYAAAALTALPLNAVRRHLQALHRNRLLDQPVHGRYRMHDLVGEYARTRAAADPEAERDQALARLFDYYQHTAGLADTHLTRIPHHGRRQVPLVPAAVPAIPNHARALAWMQAEQANMRACIDHAAGRHDEERVVALTAAVAASLRRTGPWDAAVHHHAIAATTAADLHDRRAAAEAFNQLGIVLRLTGDFQRAAVALGLALDLAGPDNDRLSQANALHSLGVVRQAAADYPAAADALRQSLDLYRELDNRLGEANALSELGAVLYLLDDYSASTDALTRALTLYRELGNRPGEANALNYLGAALRLAGDLAGSVDALREAMARYRDLADQRGEANALSLLGVVLRLTGDLAGAGDAFARSLDVYISVGDRRGEANALNHLGVTRRLTGDYPGALTSLGQALGLCRALGSRLGEANALNQLGIVRRLLGDHPGAIDVQGQALRIYQELRSRLGEANVLRETGVVRQEAHDHPGAANDLGQALRIYRELGDRPGEVETLNNMGALSLDRDSPREALVAYREALSLAQTTRNHLEQARALEGIGRCARRLGNDADADRDLRLALDIYQRIGAAQAQRLAAELT